MARRLQQLGAGRVLAFEPTRDSAAKLRAAVAATGLVTVVDNFSPHLSTADDPRWVTGRRPSTSS
jgi:hypothetical protein